ncbi:mitochondria-eating protein-like [Acanthaster planci]|uniref:Mitochondria-eating protein n=1 Tax=Acanthaster planci TaxID=133434 RepID=A0A8B7YJL7_ACAPL|nr:mitochondria-eating protein-like [Acanthaster planci]
MAESLRRLVKTGGFNTLQDKLDLWSSNYLVNTCDQNVSRCCELIELTSRLQGQLFLILNLSAAEGGIYGGCDALKNRLLPWLTQGFTSSNATTDLSLDMMADVAAKDRALSKMRNDYEAQLQDLEEDLNTSRNVSDSLKQELQEAKSKLDEERSASVGEAILNEEDTIRLSTTIKALKDELEIYRSRVGVLENYEVEARRLREDVNLLREEKAILTGRMDYLTSPLPPTSPRTTSSVSSDVVQRVRQAHLVTRFGDMFSRDRMDAMDILRTLSDDHDIHQQIVFACVEEAFHCAKKAYRLYRSKVRSTLQLTHTGPETLEEAVQNYINKNGQLLDVHSIVQDVLLAMNTHPVLSYPPEVDFKSLSLFIRELVKVAWDMSALPNPLDILPARRGELFDDFKYRRSYDSEYSAPLVSHYVWPALQEVLTGKILLKGEAVTRRGATLASPRRSRSPNRAVTPRSGRSPSPRRIMDRSLSPAGSRPGSSLSPRPMSASSSFSSY